MQGYQSAEYAKSLTEFGVPRSLPCSGGWILVRPISGTQFHDAMGCYPLFSCPNWAGLEIDLRELETDLVSLAVVVDPFGEYDAGMLMRCFPDVLYRFKDHCVVDLSQPLEIHVSRHHRRYARKALESLEVRRCADPSQAIDVWTGLYETLIERHQITGVAAFSKASFASQLSVPGITAFEARHNGTTVGMLLWYVQGSVAYYHLGAFSDDGYRLKASFGLFWSALEYFASRGFCCADLGAGAGTQDTSSGLTRFKQGWSKDTRPVFFGGRIIQPAEHEQLSSKIPHSTDDYFPHYRRGEFI